MKFSISRLYDKDTFDYLHGRTFIGLDVYTTDNPLKMWGVWTEDKELVGMCSLTVLPSEGNTAFLSRAGVLPQYEGKGLHKRMIRVREKYARRHGINWILTYTQYDNIKSSRNLQKMGYFVYIPEDLYVGRDYLYWNKKL